MPKRQRKWGCLLIVWGQPHNWWQKWIQDYVSYSLKHFNVEEEHKTLCRLKEVCPNFHGRLNSLKGHCSFRCHELAEGAHKAWLLLSKLHLQCSFFILWCAKMRQGRGREPLFCLFLWKKACPNFHGILNSFKVIVASGVMSWKKELTKLKTALLSKLQIPHATLHTMALGDKRSLSCACVRSNGKEEELIPSCQLYLEAGSKQTWS